MLVLMARGSRGKVHAVVVQGGGVIKRRGELLRKRKKLVYRPQQIKISTTSGMKQAVR